MVGRESRGVPARANGNSSAMRRGGPWWYICGTGANADAEHER